MPQFYFFSLADSGALKNSYSANSNPQSDYKSVLQGLISSSKSDNDESSLLDVTSKSMRRRNYTQNVGTLWLLA